MFKHINSKKLLFNSFLAGTIVAGNFIVSSSHESLQAGSCKDNGHGSNYGLSADLTIDDVTHTITVDKFDPSNPGNKKNLLIQGLEDGETFTNGMTISYSNGPFNLTNTQAKYIVENLPDEENCIDNQTIGDPFGIMTPSAFPEDGGTKSIAVSQEIELERKVTLDLEDLKEIIDTKSEKVKPKKLDILFLADNTGSMGEPIQNVQDNAQELLEKIDEEFGEAVGGDVQFGVAWYKGDPSEYSDSKTKTRIKTGTKEVTKWIKGEQIGTHKMQVKQTWIYKDFNYNANSANDKPYKYTLKIETKNLNTGHSSTKYRGTYWRKESDLDGKIKREYTWNKKIYKYNKTTKTVDTYKNIWTVTKSQEEKAYGLLEPVNGGSKDDAINAINEWINDPETHNGKSNGNPYNTTWEEGGLFALHQAATSGAETDKGHSTGLDTQWRDDADKKVIVIFGDANSHTNSIDLDETIKALTNDNDDVSDDIAVIAINIDTTDKDILTGDQSVDKAGLDGDEQASKITKETDGQYASVYSDKVAETIQESLGTTALVDTTINIYSDPKINIGFRSAGETPGLDVTYACLPSPDACLQVGDGAEVNFKMTIKGQLPNNYSFDTVTYDVDSDENVDGANASNDITVHSVD